MAHRTPCRFVARGLSGWVDYGTAGRVPLFPLPIGCGPAVQSRLLPLRTGCGPAGRVLCFPLRVGCGSAERFLPLPLRTGRELSGRVQYYPLADRVQSECCVAGVALSVARRSRTTDGGPPFEGVSPEHSLSMTISRAIPPPTRATHPLATSRCTHGARPWPRGRDGWALRGTLRGRDHTSLP